jgi:hypothetical protein
LAYQPPVSNTFLSQQISHQQSTNNTFLSEQASTSQMNRAKDSNKELPRIGGPYDDVVDSWLMSWTKASREKEVKG